MSSPTALVKRFAYDPPYRNRNAAIDAAVTSVSVLPASTAACQGQGLRYTICVFSGLFGGLILCGIGYFLIGKTKLLERKGAAPKQSAGEDYKSRFDGLKARYDALLDQRYTSRF